MTFTKSSTGETTGETVLQVQQVLIIQEQVCFEIDTWRVKVESYLGQSADVHYFQVYIHPEEAEPDAAQLGLLRVGSIGGSLSREMELRQTLGDYKMISEILACSTQDIVTISSGLAQPESNGSFEEILTQESEDESEASDYLEEEFFEPLEIVGEASAAKIILLSYLPAAAQTLAAWLTQEHPLEQSLLVASQVCQLLRYVYQQSWCLVQIYPQLVQMGTPVQFFDLTGAYPVGSKLNYGIIGDYCPPEISYGYGMQEQTCSYVVGTLLYQSIHRQMPNWDDGVQPEIKPIPRIYQILSNCLSPTIAQRFPLSQLLSLLVETRQLLSNPQVQWHVAGHSTTGLHRLSNQDSYGVRGVRQQTSDRSDTGILAVVADGMGGMEQGEVASRLAVETVMSAAVPTDLNSIEERDRWLESLVQKANEVVADRVENGGTTLSLVWAIGRQLAIAHVGDSRIFLLRNDRICQLSEDHSLAAMLLASGHITYEESQGNPNRNVLTKCLGSKRRLNADWIQNLSLFDSDFSISLHHGDILLICSDGVWDLVPADELVEIFTTPQSLQSHVEVTIERVLARGARDNATIVALKCDVENYC
ncbi:MAG: serine/threonine-protein phosphatase [Hormoscilla sp. SP5CHS1]|nr:serine/threonine-protein phosphatase [Hormoscilla sp. SP5CHS1]